MYRITFKNYRLYGIWKKKYQKKKVGGKGEGVQINKQYQF